MAAEKMNGMASREMKYQTKTTTRWTVMRRRMMKKTVGLGTSESIFHIMPMDLDILTPTLKDAPIIEVVDHSAPQSSKANTMSKRELKAFMVSPPFLPNIKIIILLANHNSHSPLARQTKHPPPTNPHPHNHPQNHPPPSPKTPPPSSPRTSNSAASSPNPTSSRPTARSPSPPLSRRLLPVPPSQRPLPRAASAKRPSTSASRPSAQRCPSTSRRRCPCTCARASPPPLWRGRLSVGVRLRRAVSFWKEKLARRREIGGVVVVAVEVEDLDQRWVGSRVQSLG